MSLDPPVLLARLGIRGAHLRLTSMGAVGLCLGLWIRAKTVTQAQRANAERRALFVGLWPPTIYLLGESLERRSRGGRALSRRRSGLTIRRSEG